MDEIEQFIQDLQSLMLTYDMAKYVIDLVRIWKKYIKGITLMRLLGIVEKV